MATVVTFSLTEVCSRIGVDRVFVEALVAEGIIEPQETSTPLEAWRFSEAAVIRLSKARRMHHDLGLNAAGIALALELLDELSRVRRR